MGVRGELFSTKVALQNRTYFFNVKENRLGDLYLNIVESKNREESGFDRQSVILFADDLQQFLRGFDDALRVLEKAVREKHRGGQKPPVAFGDRASKSSPPNKGAWPSASKKTSGPPETHERSKWQDRASGEGNRPRNYAKSEKYDEKPRTRRVAGRGVDGRGVKEHGAKERGAERRHTERHHEETRYVEKRRNDTKRKDKESNYSNSGPQKKRVVVKKRRDTQK